MIKINPAKQQKPKYDIDYGSETLTKTFITISSN